MTRVQPGFFISDKKTYFIIKPKHKTQKTYNILEDDYSSNKPPFSLENSNYFVVLSYTSIGLYDHDFVIKNYPRYLNTWQGDLKDTISISVE